MKDLARYSSLRLDSGSICLPNKQIQLLGCLMQQSRRLLHRVLLLPGPQDRLRHRLHGAHQYLTLQTDSRSNFAAHLQYRRTLPSMASHNRQTCQSQKQPMSSSVSNCTSNRCSWSVATAVATADEAAADDDEAASTAGYVIIAADAQQGCSLRQACLHSRHSSKNAGTAIAERSGVCQAEFVWGVPIGFGGNGGSRIQF